MTLSLDSLQYAKEFPEIVFAVNEDGYFIDKKDVVKTPLQNAMYWQRQYRKIGAIVSISGIILLMILLSETELITMVWDFLLSFVGGFL